MTNRRDFFKKTSMLAAGGVLAANGSVSASSNTASNTSAKKSFGLQTYSLTVNREDREFSDNVPNGLKRLAQMGYTTLELAGYNTEGKIGAVPMTEFKKYADDAGLKIVSSHVGSAERGLHTKDNLQAHLDHWKRVAEHHAAIGCKKVIQPGQPSMRNVADVALVGEHYNEIGKAVKAAGLVFGYHNHDGEFQRVFPGGQMALPLGRRGWPFGIPEGAKIIMDGLLEVFDPSLVVFELDVYWCVMGLQDPVAWMKKYPNHIRMLHIKDVEVLGESGMMNFQKIFETGYANGITDFIVELEYYSGGTQFEGVKGCADYLLAANFVK